MKMFIVAFSILLAAAASPAAANQLLTNPGFENDFVGWKVMGGQWEAQNAIVNEGTTAAKATVVAVPSEYYAEVWQSKAVSAAQYPNLYATVAARPGLIRTSSARIGLIVRFYNNAELISSQKDEIGGIANWRSLFVAAKTPSAANRVEFSLYIYAAKDQAAALKGKSCYFDKAVLSSEPLKGYQTTLVNGTFENGTSDWNEPGYDLPAKAVTGAGNVQAGQIAAHKTVNTKLTQPFYGEMSQDIYYRNTGVVYPEGTFVNIKGFVKPQFNPTTRSVTGFKLRFFNAADVELGSVEKLTGGTSLYRELYLSGKTPKDTKYVRVTNLLYVGQADVPKGGNVLFDSISYSLTTFPGYPLPVTNLLNENFENGLTDWQDPFMPSAVSTAVKHGGLYAAAMKVSTVDSSDFYSEIRQNIDVNSSTRPVAKARIWANSVLKSGVGQFRIEFYDAAGNLMQEYTRSRNITGTSGWTEYALQNINIPSGAVKMRFVCSLWAGKGSNAKGDVVYFDDAAITFAQ